MKVSTVLQRLRRLLSFPAPLPLQPHYDHRDKDGYHLTSSDATATASGSHHTHITTATTTTASSVATATTTQVLFETLSSMSL